MNRSPLDLDQETMRRLGHQVVDVIAAHLANIREQPVIGSIPRAALNEALLAPPPRAPTDCDSIRRTPNESALPGATAIQSPTATRASRIPDFSPTCRAARRFRRFWETG